MAEATLIASNRPWLDLDISISGPLTFDQEGAHLPIVVSTQNVGHSPAVRVSDSQEFVQSLLSTNPQPWQELKKVCDQAAGQSAQSLNRGLTVTIFGGKPQLRQIRMNMGPQELSKSLRDIFPDMKEIPPTIDAQVIWCVGYRGDFETTTHRTGYIWEVRRKTERGIEMIPRSAITVPAQDLVLVPSLFGPLAD